MTDEDHDASQHRKGIGPVRVDGALGPIAGSDDDAVNDCHFVSSCNGRPYDNMASLESFVLNLP